MGNVPDHAIWRRTGTSRSVTGRDTAPEVNSDCSGFLGLAVPMIEVERVMTFIEKRRRVQFRMLNSGGRNNRLPHLHHGFSKVSEKLRVRLRS